MSTRKRWKIHRLLHLPRLPMEPAMELLVHLLYI
jgi:hypothetical protein